MSPLEPEKSPPERHTAAVNLEACGAVGPPSPPHPRGCLPGSIMGALPCMYFSTLRAFSSPQALPSCSVELEGAECKETLGDGWHAQAWWQCLDLSIT